MSLRPSFLRGGEAPGFSGGPGGARQAAQGAGGGGRPDRQACPGGREAQKEATLTINMQVMRSKYIKIMLEI